MVRIYPTQSVKVYQTDYEQLQSLVSFRPAGPHYTVLEHETVTSVWAPASGYRINLVSMVLSVEGAGVLEVRHTDTTFIHVEFSERKAVPLGLATVIQLGVDEPIKAIFTSDVGSDSAFITLFGYETEG
ncbi:MAG: hypothetical protein ACTSPB_01605 [Candidatus Thorarchaeota archaeon]